MMWQWRPSMRCARRRTKAALTLEQMLQQQLIRYIPFPDALRGKYQSYTQADIASLRGIGYAQPFLTVEQGTERYVNQLLKQST